MELKGKNVVVAGLGESGLAMAAWLVEEGARVTVADSRPMPPNQDALARRAPGARLQAGAFTPSTFADADLVALSPGIATDSPALQGLQVPVVSEIELFAWAIARDCPESRVLAITGSNGKTTTTALTAHLLNRVGCRAQACGNISPSALDAFLTARAASAYPAVWVLELSSFQLETTYHLNAQGAAFLNLSEDHLDRHGSMAHYGAIKSRVFQGKGLMVLNRDDDHSLGNGRCGRAMVTFGLNPPPRQGDYGLRDGYLVRGERALVPLADLPIHGLHNAANVMAALALTEALPRTLLGGGDDPLPALLDALKNFRGLPHRVEKVATVAGVDYVDDSKGTNVGATLAAIQGLGGMGAGKVAIVLGGDGKGQDFSPLVPALAAHGRAVALIGRDGEAIGATLAAAGVNLPVRFWPSLEEATRWLATQAQTGDCVLLSPACASLDMFRNYAHRADVFIATVGELAAATGDRS